jgi:hypothetical protein
MCFPASGVSQKKLHYSFSHKVEPYNKLLDEIPRPSHMPKRRNPAVLYQGSEGARD